MDILNFFKKHTGAIVFRGFITACILLTALLFATTASAQFTPKGFNYQCAVRNAAGQPMANQTVSLLFAIKSGAPNGPVAYAESQLLSTNEFGMVNTVIGDGIVVQGAFDAINWGGGAKYISVSLESNPGVFDELGTSEFQSVPYAMYALSAANGGTGGDDWGSQTIQSGATLDGNGTQTNPLKLAQQGAQTGQVLKWDGSKWVPQDDISDTGANGGTVTQINTGAGLIGGPITTDGTIQLAPTGVTPGAYGSATEIPVITIDANGRITNVWKVVPSPGTVGIAGAAGITVQQMGTNFTITNTGDTNANDDLTINSMADGDLSGSFSNLQLKANTVTTLEIVNQTVRGIDINQMDATPGEVLKWNGTIWQPDTDENSGLTEVTIAAGTGIAVSGNTDNFTVTNTGDTDASDDLLQSDLADGDISGTFDDLQLKNNVVETSNISNLAVTTSKIANMAVASNKISDGAVTSDKIADDAVTTNKIKDNAISTDKLMDDAVTSDKIADISITTNKIKNAAVTTAKIGDVAVTTDKLADASITAAKLGQMGAVAGEVLKWDGTAWVASDDDSGAGAIDLLAGTGVDIDVSGNTYTISNIGDIDPDDDLTDATVFNGDVSGVFDDLQLNPNVVSSTEIENGTVRTVDMRDLAITTDKVDDFAITSIKIADEAVTTDKIEEAAITADKLNQMGAQAGQVLKWDGTTWTAANDLTATGGGGSNTYSAGSGISITGTSPNFTIANTGDLNPNDDLNTSSLFAGDVSGNYNDLTLNNNTVTSSKIVNGSIMNADIGDGEITGSKIATMNAQFGQVLKWTGISWAPSDDLTGGGTGGSNWTLTGQNISPVPSGNVLIGQNINNSGRLQVTSTTTSQEAAVFKIAASASPKTALVSETNGTGIAGFFTSTGGPALVTGNGPVGVGVAAPQAQLHIASSTAPQVLIDGPFPEIGFKPGNSPVTAYLTHDGKNFTLKSRTDSVTIGMEPNGFPSLYASPKTGSVGIGAKSNTDHALHVSHRQKGLAITNQNSNHTWELWTSTDGELVLYNDLLPTGTAAGTFGVTGMYTSSDKRLKDDIRPMLGVLSKINSIPAVSYQFKGSTERTIGFLAQDVQAVFPELVTTTPIRDGKGGFLAVNYGAMTAVALQAVREQQKEIEDLKAENDTLKARLDAIEARLQKLED